MNIIKLLKINLVLFASCGFLLAVSNCEGSKSRKNEIQLAQNAPFIIVDVYSQDWISGIKGGGSGTNLHISFKELSKEVVVRDMYFRNKIVKAQVSPNNRNEYIGFYKNKTNNDVIMDIDPLKERQNTPPDKIPFQLDEHEAVISYLYRGSLQYYKIVDIEKKPLIAYPMTNSKNDQ